jgi:hypothetical protein
MKDDAAIILIEVVKSYDNSEKERKRSSPSCLSKSCARLPN